MGLLSLDKDTTFNLNKATVSVWFRIPQAAFDAVAPATSFWGYDVFNGIIPIIVFGKQSHGPTSSIKQEVFGQYYVDGDLSKPQNVIGPVNEIRTAPMSPTVIGVAKGESSGNLFVHLQTDDMGNNANTNQDTVGWTPLVNNLGVPYGVDRLLAEDNSEADNKLEFISRGGVEVLLDQWHHLLISWDLGSGNASHGTETVDSSAHLADFVDAYSTMYCALDDQNINEFDLPALWVEGGGSNDVICDGAFSVAGRTRLGVSGDISTFSVEFIEGINVNAIYIPADSISYERDPGPSFEEPSDAGIETGNVIAKVEMAELQIFTDLVIDTSLESKRRAFIDFERDENGNKVLDEAGKGTLKPVKPEQTEKLLSRRPDILLHGTSNWIAGKNTGSTGLIRPDNIIPLGQFVRTGTIRKYTPDPARGET